jgi:hypothetical protein
MDQKKNEDIEAELSKEELKAVRLFRSQKVQAHMVGK